MNDKKSHSKVRISPKGIIRALALVCMVFVFCPSFLVSCSGQEVEIDVMTAVNGLSLYGKPVTEPQPIMVICLIIPIVIVALTVIKGLSGRKTAGVTLVISAVDLVAWHTFKSTVESLAQENYCTMEVTSWYYMNFASLICISIISILVVIKKVDMSADLRSSYINKPPFVSFPKVSDKVSQLKETLNSIRPEETQSFCSMCGKAIPNNSNFCIDCGHPVSEMDAQITNEEQDSTVSPSTPNPNLFCMNCGARLDDDALFCNVCGIKVE